MTKLEKQILEHLKAIRDVLEENGGVQYLSMCIFDDGLITANNATWKLPAEKEIALEEQVVANRCGEGQCEYFESIRRAANNNRGNGYCKKYKRELLLYDWWWLKCDECAAEKELAEEKWK